MKDLLHFTAGMGLGSALAFWLDPIRGHRRRTLVRDKGTHALHRFEEAAEVVSKDLGNRTRGLYAKTRYRLRREGTPEDNVLVARIRAKMGRFVSHPRAVQVDAHDGVVTLRGPIFESEIRRLMAHIRTVKGVRRIENFLEGHRSDDGISSLQGERHVAHPPLLRKNWSPTARFFTGTAGVALASVGALNFRTSSPSSRKSAAAALLTGTLLIIRSLAYLPNHFPNPLKKARRKAA